MGFLCQVSTRVKEAQHSAILLLISRMLGVCQPIGASVTGPPCSLHGHSSWAFIAEVLARQPRMYDVATPPRVCVTVCPGLHACSAGLCGLCRTRLVVFDASLSQGFPFAL